jgi:hypothetical protein
VPPPICQVPKPMTGNCLSSYKETVFMSLLELLFVFKPIVEIYYKLAIERVGP